MPLYLLIGKAIWSYVCELAIASRIFGIVLGPKKRSILTAKSDFIFKGLPRAGFRWFAIVAIARCRLRFAVGSAAEGSVGHVVSGSQK